MPPKEILPHLRAQQKERVHAEGKAREVSVFPGEELRDPAGTAREQAADWHTKQKGQGNKGKMDREVSSRDGRGLGAKRRAAMGMEFDCCE